MRSSFKRFWSSSKDAETLAEMRDKIAMAHRRFQVSCPHHTSLCALVYAVSDCG